MNSLRGEIDTVTTDLLGKMPTVRVAKSCLLMQYQANEVKRVTELALGLIDEVSCSDSKLVTVENLLKRAKAGVALLERAAVHESDTAKAYDKFGDALVEHVEKRSTFSREYGDRVTTVRREMVRDQVDSVLINQSTPVQKRKAQGQGQGQGQGQAKKKKKKQPPKNFDANKDCYRCGTIGHIAKYCPKK